MAFMRHNNNGRRHNNSNRHRHQNNGNNQQGQQGQRRHVNRVNHVFESNGPEGRVRGTAQQIVEKYMTMARDAQTSGDKVLSMNYFQHAEHYQRVLNDIVEENAVFEREREAQRAAQQAAQAEAAEAAGDAENAVADAQGATSAGDENDDNAVQPPQRASRNAASRNNAPRTPARRKNAEDDLNALPGFLQVPITESAPPVSVDGAASASVAKDNAAEEKPRAARAVRARRTAASAVSAEADAADKAE